jgi:hypothetical protein
VHAYGRTLRRVGDLRLLGLPVGSGRERYGVADGFEPVATYPTLEQALAAFEAVCDATAASGVTDPAAFRLRRGRPRGSAPQGRRPSGAMEPERAAPPGPTAAAATEPRVRGGRGGMAVAVALAVAVLGLGVLIGEALYRRLRRRRGRARGG